MSAEGNGQVLAHVIREVPLAGAEGAIADAIRGLREDGGVRVISVNTVYRTHHAQVTVMAEGSSEQAVKEAVARHFPAAEDGLAGDGLRQQSAAGLWAAD